MSVSADPARTDFGLAGNRIWKSALLVMGLLVTLLILVRPLHSNIHWLLATSQQLFSEPLYSATGTHYSPITLLFYWLLSWLGIPSSIASERWLLLVLAALLLPSARVSARLLAAQTDSISASRGLFLLVFFVLFVLPNESFGTTPHLFVSLSLPYYLLGLARVRGRYEGNSTAWLAGALAGLGFWIAPEYLLSLLVILPFLATMGSFRVGFPEHQGLLISFLLLGLLASVLQPGFFPEFLSSSRSFLAFSLPELAVSWSTWDLYLTAIAVWLAARWFGFGSSGLVFLAVVCFSLAAVPLLVAYDFGNHFYPADALAALLLGQTGFLIVSSIQSQGSRKPATAVLALFLLSTLVLETSLAIQDASRTWMLWSGSVPGRFEKELGGILKGKELLFLSSSYWPGQPVANYLQARPLFAESLLWDLPRNYREGLAPRTSADMSDTEKGVLDRMVQIFVDHRPEAVIVDGRTEKIGFGNRAFDYLSYFDQDKRFQIAWEDYSLGASIGPFNIYLRKDLAAAR